MTRVYVEFSDAGDVLEYRLAPSRSWTRDCWRAIQLAPGIEICEALLRGESVPFDRLDQSWVRRFGRRRR
jgi:hypothetical protein